MQSYRQLTGTALFSELRCGRVPRWLQEWRGFEASQLQLVQGRSKSLGGNLGSTPNFATPLPLMFGHSRNLTTVLSCVTHEGNNVAHAP